MYKVFVNDNPLVVTEEYPDLKHEDLILYMKFDDNVTLLQAIEVLQGDGYVNKVIVYHPHQNEVWETLISNFKHIEAAGGIVTNDKDERLFIYRRGKWDLPKGKLDTGETPEQAAIREVAEETGLSGLEITGTLPNTYHTYSEKGTAILKTTHWFAMRCSQPGPLTPEAKEGIEAAEWLPPGADGKVFENTFASVRELLSN